MLGCCRTTIGHGSEIIVTICTVAWVNVKPGNAGAEAVAETGGEGEEDWAYVLAIGTSVPRDRMHTQEAEEGEEQNQR